MSETVLWIEGMCCEDCRTRLRDALRGVEGVERVYVDLNQNEATVWGTATRSELVAATVSAGFSVSPYPVPEARGIG